MSAVQSTINYFKEYMERNVGIEFKNEQEVITFLKELLEEKEQ